MVNNIQTKSLFRFVALVTLIFVTGCTLGPDFKKPVIQTPDHFRFDDIQDQTTADNLKWWELFDDPIISSLVTAALAENKNVMIATSRIREAHASLGFTRADMLPRLDLEAGASRGNFAGGRKSAITDNNYFIAPTLSWEIDFWGKFRRTTEAAQAELMASEYSLKTVQISLIAEVVSTYFILLDFHQRLEISQRTLESRQQSLDVIEKRFAEGIIPEIDLNQAQIQKETAAAAIPSYERLVAKTENALSILLGRSPAAIKKGNNLYNQTIPPAIPPGLPSALLQRRPDILQAEYLLKAQNARIGAAQALRLPAIGLTGIYGAASNELSTLTSNGAAWSVGGSLLGPVFNFDQDKMRVEIEKERTKQALYYYENTVLTAFRDVEDALNEIHTYKRQISAVKNKLKAASNALTLSKLRYDKGVTSFLEVLDTERIWFSVALELSELKQQYHNAYVKLYKALGGGWLSREQIQQDQAQPGM